MKTRFFIMLTCVLIWIGFVCSISFMEAWLKFQAPGITIVQGLGIGALVFDALNKVQWVLALLTTACLIDVRKHSKRSSKIYLSILWLILLLQSFWMLPQLDKRANALMDGASLAPSYLHFYFIAAEVCKVALLFFLSHALYKDFGNFLVGKGIRADTRESTNEELVESA